MATPFDEYSIGETFYPSPPSNTVTFGQHFGKISKDGYPGVKVLSRLRERG